MAPIPLMPDPQDAASAVASSRQLLLVVAPGWDNSAGQLQRFARPGLADDWRAVGEALTVSLGRAGLAWGLGLHPMSGTGGKREGDGRAPAGIYALPALFGDAPPDSLFARAAKLPYLFATENLKAVDDPASLHYNRIVDQTAVAQRDWASCEDMRRKDRRYAVGVVVAHNGEPVVPGAGSCIFMHVWEREGAPTAGCTAMSLADMSEIAGWLDGAARPLLVQLPQAEYEAVRDAWQLPGLAG